MWICINCRDDARAPDARLILHILREASALSVLLRRAIPEPLCVGRTSSDGSHAFFYQSLSPTRGPEAHKTAMRKRLLFILSAVILALSVTAQDFIQPHEGKITDHTVIAGLPESDRRPM